MFLNIKKYGCMSMEAQSLRNRREKNEIKSSA